MDHHGYDCHTHKRTRRGGRTFESEVKCWQATLVDGGGPYTGGVEGESIKHVTYKENVSH